MPLPPGLDDSGSQQPAGLFVILGDERCALTAGAAWFRAQRAGCCHVLLLPDSARAVKPLGRQLRLDSSAFV